MNSNHIRLTLLDAASRFQLPDHQTGSPSPSRSPNRRDYFAAHELDPLLSNLSPVSTLEALKATDAVSFEEGSKGKILSDSIADSSASERALGIRAALAGKKLREWCTEVQAWHWPEGNFEPPAVGHRGKEHITEDHEGSLDKAVSPKAKDTATNQQQEHYLGSLPLRAVEEIENRIEDIRDHMEMLEVAELKDHVRGAHLLPHSRSSSTYVADMTGSPIPKVNHLDDFTVVVTATIMQALPYISRLNSLLDMWFIRTVILRQVPNFLQRLEDAQIAVDAAWNAIHRPSTVSQTLHSDLTREAFSTMKGILQDRVSDLGQRLDTMLDVLEGCHDRIPDHWIDKMEKMQEEYENWVVRAEGEVEQNEWLAQKMRADEVFARIASGQIPNNQNKDAAYPIDRHEISSVPESSGIGSLSDNLTVTERNTSSKESTETEKLGERDDGQHRLGGTESISHLLNTSLPEALHEPTSDETESSELLKANPETFVSSNQYIEHYDMAREPRIESARAGLDDPAGILATRETTTIFKTNDGTTDDQFISTKTTQRSPGRALARKPTPLHLADNKSTTEDEAVSSEPGSGVSRPSTANSSNLSDISSPQILDAASIQFFKTPMEEAFPSWVTEDVSPEVILSRHSSQRTERSSHTVSARARRVSLVDLNSRSRASSYLSDLARSDGRGRSGSMSAIAGDVESRSGSVLALNKASTASIESLPRSELRNITIRRNSSYSSSSSARVSTKDDLSTINPPTDLSILERVAQNQKELEADLNHFDSAFKDVAESPSIRLPRRRLASFPSMSTPTDDNAPTAGILAAPEQRIVEEPSDQPTSPSKAKSQHHIVSSPDSNNFLTIRNEAIGTNGNIEDQLTARISSILTNIPARIRLAAGPEESALEIKSTSLSPGTLPEGTLAPTTRLQRSVSSTPSITLAPAYSKTSKVRPPHGDSDIKLYHLHQPGKDLPIKLFVRLVGEGGERVMVRVGGGWADLGEYLREYVSHHGRRSVSGGKFELKGLPAAQSAAVVATLGSFNSGRSTPVSRPETPTYQSGSSFSIRKVRRSSGVSSSPYTPETSGRQWATTPTSADSYNSSVRSSSRASWTEEDAPLGLAGPKSRKVEISPQKKAWVDGMLNQARQFSSEKKKAVPGVGDLGRAGSTRRVFLKTKAED